MNNSSLDILQVLNIKKDFSGLAVLMDVNFNVMSGERHAIIGPNGAGKTTLFNIISGNFKPSGGKIIFQGKDTSGKPPHELTKMKMGRSFQITNLFSELTALENVMSGVRCFQGLKYSFFRKPENNLKIKNRALEIIELIGLSDVADKLVSSLSYGQQRALEIGVTLSIEPELILLDEPTAGMTREETANTIRMVDQVTKGTSMIIIEHDMDVVFSLADTISVLHYGKILASGTPNEIRNNEEVKTAYLGEE